MMEKQLIPAGYKQTEVGVIPEDWEAVELSQLVDKGRLPSGLYKDQKYYGYGTQIIKLGDVFRLDSFDPDAAQRVELSPAEMRAYAVSLGDIFIALASVKLEGVGKVMHVSNLIEATAYDHNVALIRPLDTCESKYLFYVLKSDAIRSLVKMNATQVGTSFLKASTILSFLVPKPAKQEQTAIANALSDVDALIAALEKLINKKSAIKTAAMQQLLTGKKRLPPFDQLNTGYKQTELGEIPGDWEVIELGSVATFLKGKGLPKSDVVQGGIFECIHYGELFTKYNEYIETIFSRTNVGADAILSKSNDVLMPTSDVTPNGLATASGLKRDGVILGGDILIIRAAESVLDSSFLAYTVSISKDQILQLVTGSTVYHLYGSDMAKFKFCFPSNTKEQTAIANVLSDMDKDLEALQQRLHKTQQIKQGMMQELLTGKTRLIK